MVIYHQQSLINLPAQFQAILGHLTITLQIQQIQTMIIFITGLIGMMEITVGG